MGCSLGESQGGQAGASRQRLAKSNANLVQGRVGGLEKAAGDFIAKQVRVNVVHMRLEGPVHVGRAARGRGPSCDAQVSQGIRSHHLGRGGETQRVAVRRESVAPIFLPFSTLLPSKGATFSASL